MAREQKVKIVVPSDQQQPSEYELDSFLEEIKDIYGEGDTWSNITLYWLDPQNEWSLIDHYSLPPKEYEIADKWGGGKYKLFIQWKKPDGSRQMRTKFMKAAGAHKNPAAVEIISGNGQHQNNSAPVAPVQDQFEMFIKFATLLKTLNPPAAADGGGAATAAITGAMQLVGTMITTLAGKGENKDGPLLTYLQSVNDNLMKVALNKSGDGMDQALSLMDIIDRRAGSKSGGDDWASVVKELAPQVPMLLAGLTGKMPPEAIAALGAGGAPGALGATGGIEGALRGILQPYMDKIDDIAKRLNDVETYLENPDAEDKPAGENASTSLSTPELEIVNKVPTLEEQEMNDRNLIKILDAMPEAGQMAQLKIYLKIDTVENIWKWYSTYGGTKTLDQFNEMLEKAGEKKYMVSTNESGGLLND